jgi:hypothetical protein
LPGASFLARSVRGKWGSGGRRWVRVRPSHPDAGAVQLAAHQFAHSWLLYLQDSFTLSVARLLLYADRLGAEAQVKLKEIRASAAA